MSVACFISSSFFFLFPPFRKTSESSSHFPRVKKCNKEEDVQKEVYEEKLEKETRIHKVKMVVVQASPRCITTNYC